MPTLMKSIQNTDKIRQDWNKIGLTHWGRVTHICVRKLIIIGSDNGLSAGRRQAIIWTSAVILLIGSLGTNFNEILIRIQTFSFKKMQLKMSSVKWRPFSLGLNVLNGEMVIEWWKKPTWGDIIVDVYTETERQSLGIICGCAQPMSKDVTI